MNSHIYALFSWLLVQQKKLHHFYFGKTLITTLIASIFHLALFIETGANVSPLNLSDILAYPWQGFDQK
jgi:hypothetical protein